MDLVEPTPVSRWNWGRESRRHLYVIGQTGTGKSTLLLNGARLASTIDVA